MVWTKEERLAHRRAYHLTPKGKKSNRISCWKTQGIIVEYNDWDTFYEYVIATTHCQKENCDKELTTDKLTTHSTRVVDHDHSIKNKPNVRYVCCNACNIIEKSNNTSGEPNIIYIKKDKIWRFQKMIQGKKYWKSGFKTLEEAIQYKKQFLENLLV